MGIDVLSEVCSIQKRNINQRDGARDSEAYECHYRSLSVDLCTVLLGHGKTAGENR